MKDLPIILIIILLLAVTACEASGPACPSESISYLSDPNLAGDDTSQANQNIDPQIIEIKGREIQVDRVINGTLCNDNWSGTIYVPCDIQVYHWQEEPTFFQNCDLRIEPGTVVYVAAHNDEPYYQGCSCHTGGGGN